MEILEDLNVIRQRDPQDALGVIAEAANQAAWEAVLEQVGDDVFAPGQIVLAGMGGSALAGSIAKKWLDYQHDLSQSFEVVRDYTLPNYVNSDTLVICFSVSGNTEETLAALEDAQIKGAHVAIVASGGKLLEHAQEHNLPYVELAKISQPRYGVIMHLRAITKILAQHGITLNAYDEIADLVGPISDMVASVAVDVPTVENPAKQLALQCAGKTPIVYASSLFAPLAYKWKIGFNENAKNTSWMDEFPEFSHNEFMGWASHPIEKPFAIIDLRSQFDHPRIGKRFELTEKLLSGRRPATHEVWLRGDSVLGQMLTGIIMADFTSIYLGILNGVNPTPVELVEQLKKELA
ncbi:bifunctional phosphoglucose/phosphomannose isomerase [Candidatus Saccharibacteria bacterium]|nr:bifunctional phosphoglucose/phosphomannose isomerase [Candidatus Saccharibacteria bacterium]